MSNYAPKTTEWMRQNNWGAKAQQLVTADLTACESRLAEAERERDQAWNDAERLRGVIEGWHHTVKQYVSQPIHDLRQQLANLTQERDALREVARALIRAGDALYVKGKFADPDYWAPCNWTSPPTTTMKSATTVTGWRTLAADSARPSNYSTQKGGPGRESTISSASRRT